MGVQIPQGRHKIIRWLYTFLREFQVNNNFAKDFLRHKEILSAVKGLESAGAICKLRKAISFVCVWVTSWEQVRRNAASIRMHAAVHRLCCHLQHSMLCVISYCAACYAHLKYGRPSRKWTKINWAIVHSISFPNNASEEYDWYN